MKELPLTKGQVAIVDDDDYELVSQFKWQAKKDGRRWYAVRTLRQGGKPKHIFLHRVLMSPSDDLRVDHIDGNGLNNQRSNLRICTHQQNSQYQGLRSSNTSGFKGICFWPRTNKWMAGVVVSSKRFHLGYFTTPEEAARAYDAAARHHFGAFAYTNFPEEATA